MSRIQGSLHGGVTPSITQARPQYRSQLSQLLRAMKTRQARAGYLFMLPSMVILAVFVFWPILQSVLLSLHHWKFGVEEQTWAGLSNYERLLKDSRVGGAFRNTLYYTAVTVPLGMLLSLLLALGLNEKIPFRGLLRAGFFLPVISSFAIMAITWSFLLDPDIGLVSYWFRQIGLPARSWLRDPDWAMPAVILVSLWKNVGFNMVIFLAGLQGISENLYEAAKMDGANSWQHFRYITLPMLRPTTLFVLVVSVIGAFQVFDPVYVMTPRGGPLFSTETIVSYIFYQGIQLIDLSYAATIGVFLFVIVFILTLIQIRVLRYRDLD